MSTITEYPVFTGELWSYDDAEKRVPTAWRRVLHQGDGWSRSDRSIVAPKGLGHFERRADGKGWVYIEPSGYARPVRENYDKPEPPPLPRPWPYKRCGCREGSHTCGACGQPYWLEFHGVADGHCTYCYHEG